MSDPAAYLAAAEADAVEVDRALAPAGVGIVGFGTMGRGIALAAAGSGFPVRIHEPDDSAWERSLAALDETLGRAVAKGRLTEAEAASRRENIRRASSESVARTDFVIEAVFEDLETKRRVFAEMDRLAPPGTILASNTSTLDLDRIADATNRPERVIGAHFFTPAHVMRLVEVVVGGRTSTATREATRALAVALGKVPVAVGVCPGFVGNRMLYAYRRAADRLLLEGALPESVDEALREFGFPMGPFAVADLAGLDIGWSARKRLTGAKEVVADRLAEAGRFGQKTGRGFFRYPPGSRTPQPDPEVAAILAEESANAGILRRAVKGEEIRERCLGALEEEGRRIVSEGIARHEADVDLIWTLGYGFPKAQGGPLFRARNR